MVIGYDQYMNLKKWKNYKEILNSVEIICFKRKNDSFNKIFPANIVDFNHDISSTLVREMIQKTKYPRKHPILERYHQTLIYFRVRL